MFNTALTLICPYKDGWPNEVAVKVASAIEKFSPSGVQCVTLGEDAVDILCTLNINDQDRHELLNQVESEIENRLYVDSRLFDVVIQPLKTRAKRLLIADMDSTIIEQECIDELAEFVGKRTEISEITERAMRGELDFEGALAGRVAMLKGLPIEKLEEAYRERITLTPGARTLVQTMRKRGVYTALVSGGFTFFTERVAKTCGFHIHQANTLLMENRVLTGEVGDPILGRAAKEEALRRFAELENIPLKQTMAVGDGANDLSMLNAAGLGVAFRAKPAVEAEADAKIWASGLTALLYLQGIPQSEFVTD